MEWFYSDDKGVKIGPITVAQIRELVKQRVIKKNTVIENGNGRRVVAGETKGLEFPPEPVPIPVTPEPVQTVPVPPVQQTSKVFCRHCGENIPHDSRFCPSCGEKTDNSPVPVQPQPVQQVYSPHPIPQSPFSESNNNEEVIVFEGQPDGFRGFIEIWIVAVIWSCVNMFMFMLIRGDEFQTQEILLLFLFAIPPFVIISLYVFLTVISTKLTITNKKSILKHGIFSRTEVELLHSDIKSIVIRQGIIERLVNVGTVYIATAATSLAAGIRASKFSNPDAIKRMIQQYQSK